MKSENCGKTMDAREIEQRTGLAEPGEHHKKSGFIIPAGILIGLGIGILAGYAFTGFLIGLGLGFVGEGLLPLVRKTSAGESAKGSANATLLLIGAFLLLIGMSIVVAPAAIWPYAFAGLFILAGFWVLFRGFSRSS